LKSDGIVQPFWGKDNPQGCSRATSPTCLAAQLNISYHVVIGVVLISELRPHANLRSPWGSAGRSGRPTWQCRSGCLQALPGGAAAQAHHTALPVSLPLCCSTDPAGGRPQPHNTIWMYTIQSQESSRSHCPRTQGGPGPHLPLQLPVPGAQAPALNHPRAKIHSSCQQTRQLWLVATHDHDTQHSAH
jgi:hypothetical protein